jgi:ribonuclease D
MDFEFTIEENIAVYYIRNAAQLSQHLDSLSNAKTISVDLEFDRERYTYGSNICLIQLYFENKCLLIDATTNNYYNVIFPALENPSILKIMHSPSEDLTLLHELNCFPVNIFDTEKAARLINVKAFSLANILAEFLQISIDKSQQKTNWTIAPIKAEQMKYAAKDVIYLPKLRDVLLSKIAQLGIEHWITEENKFWDIFRVEKKGEGQLTNKDDAKKLPPFQLFVLNELLKVRDKYAMKFNKPGFYMVPKEILSDGIFDQEIFKNWKHQHGIYHALQNDTVKNEFLFALNAAQEKAEALNLKKRKENSFLTLDERIELSNQRKLMDELVNEKFRPVHLEIIEKYGENTALYILNEKTMLELASKKITIDELPFTYRTELIRSIMNEKGITV